MLVMRQFQFSSSTLFSSPPYFLLVLSRKVDSSTFNHSSSWSFHFKFIMNFSLMPRFSGHLASIAYFVYGFFSFLSRVSQLFFLLLLRLTPIHTHSYLIDKFFQTISILAKFKAEKALFLHNSIFTLFFFFPLCFRLSFFIDDKLIFVLLRGRRNVLWIWKFLHWVEGCSEAFKKEFDFVSLIFSL